LYGLPAPAPSWSPAIPVAFGLVCGFAVGVVAWRRYRSNRRPSRGMRWRPGNRALRRGLLVGVGGITSGTVVGVLAGVVHPLSFSVFLLLWVVIVGLALGLGSVLWLSVQEVPGEISSARSPQAVLTRDRRTALIFGLLTSLLVGLTVGLLVGPLFALVFSAYLLHGILLAGFGWGFSIHFWLSNSAVSIRRFSVSDVLGIGLPLGLFVAVVTGFAAGESAWPRWVLTRAWLALYGRLPWRLMAFLADAHRRGVLRQAGAVYQFRHIELQHRLASRPGTPGSPGSPPL
jgi:MFS family permease